MSSGNKQMYKYICFVFICILCALFASCSIEGYFKKDDAKARLIVIGMDYHNSLAAPELDGTIDDAYEMAAAFKNVMSEKNVELDIHYLIQEGYDILVEARCSSLFNLQALIDYARNIFEGLNPACTGLSGSYDSETGFTFRAYVDSIATADDIKNALETAYPASSDDVISVRYSSITELSTYPSYKSIMEAIRKSSDLRANDLLVLYYTGHGETYKVISSSVLEEGLNRLYDDGLIARWQKDSLLNIPVKSDIPLQLEMSKLGFSAEATAAVAALISEEMLKSTESNGALITAKCNEDPIYGILEMKSLYKEMLKLDCKCVLIIDACYSGFASEQGFSKLDIGDAFASFLHSPSLPNVEALSASSPTETSKVTVAKTEEGTYQHHSAFTIAILKKLGWKHSTARCVYLRVPEYGLSDDGKIEEYSLIRNVYGYTSSIPSRMTASGLFDSVMTNWTGNQQTPQRNENGYEIVLIP